MSMTIAGMVVVGLLLAGMVVLAVMAVLARDRRAAVDELLRMNRELLDADRRRSGAELEGKKASIDDQVAVMRTELARLTDLVHSVERDRRQHVGALTNQLREAGRHTQVLAETTQSLREALASTSARGQWGERMAEDVLRLAGFVDGINYRKHQPTPDGRGIPDFTFLLPRGLYLHMDVKFPLSNYLRFLDATSDVERERWRKEFLRDARARLKELATRSYVDPAANTVDCVLLFIPNEQVYGFIQEHDRALLDDALRAKVVLCSPVTLFAVLAVIRQAVDNFQLSQTSHEILERLQGFEKQWGRFVEQMDKVGRSLHTASNAFDELEGTRKRQLERELDKVEALRGRVAVERGSETGESHLTPLALEA
jgi:DNA recombination protein RmuC